MNKEWEPHTLSSENQGFSTTIKAYTYSHSRFLTRQFLFAMRWAVRLRQTVTVGRSPSGTFATVTPMKKTMALTTSYPIASEMKKNVAPIHRIIFKANVSVCSPNIWSFQQFSASDRLLVAISSVCNIIIEIIDSKLIKNSHIHAFYR